MNFKRTLRQALAIALLIAAAHCASAKVSCQGMSEARCDELIDILGDVLEDGASRNFAACAAKKPSECAKASATALAAITRSGSDCLSLNSVTTHVSLLEKDAGAWEAFLNASAKCKNDDGCLVRAFETHLYAKDGASASAKALADRWRGLTRPQYALRIKYAAGLVSWCNELCGASSTILDTTACAGANCRNLLKFAGLGC